MGRANLLKLLVELSGTELSTVISYFDTMKLLRNLYLSFSGILLSIQAIKIILNILNLGDYKKSSNSMARGCNIFINVIEGLLHFGFIGSGFTILFLGFFLILDLDFAVPIVSRFKIC
jgi:hypothetical protein